jgi:hypothetical protein
VRALCSALMNKKNWCLVLKASWQLNGTHFSQRVFRHWLLKHSLRRALSPFLQAPGEKRCMCVCFLQGAALKS